MHTKIADDEIVAEFQKATVEEDSAASCEGGAVSF